MDFSIRVEVADDLSELQRRNLVNCRRNVCQKWASWFRRYGTIAKTSQFMNFDLEDEGQEHWRFDGILKARHR